MRTIIDVMTGDGPLAGAFQGGSWDAWRAYLAAVFGLPMSEASAALFRRCTGRETLPTAPAREAWMVVGRRGGKSRIAALLAVFLAAFKRYTLAAGERGVVMIIAADRRQARVAFRYVRGLLESSPMLAAMIEGLTKESIHLTNGVSIEVHTASFRAVRGYTVVAVIADEIAFWPTDDAANPDREILEAVRPAMATIPDALLVALSSPYARSGELWRNHEQHFAKDGDPILVWQAASLVMNSSLPQEVVDRAYAEDEAAAAAEYGAEFRRDIERLISIELVSDLAIPDRAMLPPAESIRSIRYTAFVDPAGGSGADSFTGAIAHASTDGGLVLDRVLEQRPPFSPETTVEQFARELRRYRVTTVTGDRYAGEWPREQFLKHGITYQTSERTKSELYLELLPLLTSRRVELLDDARLRAQLVGLERRTSRRGRDSVDHAPGRHDDVANAAAGALVTLAFAQSRMASTRKVVGW